MTKTDKGDDFVMALAKLAMQMQIEPRHAIACFGKAAAMLTQYEQMTGRVKTTEEGLQFAMEAFVDGIGTVFPVEGSTKVTAHKVQ